MSGTVTRFDWVNPHVYLLVESDADGERVTWEIEGEPPRILRKLGWTAETVQVGDRVTVSGAPARNRAQAVMRMHSLEFADGDVLDTDGGTIFEALLDDESAAASTTDSFDGVWQTAFNIDVMEGLVNGTSLSLTAAGETASADYVENRDSPGLRCATRPPPATMTEADLKLIEWHEDRIRIRTEADPEGRTVLLGLDSHENAERSPRGHSIGWMEGDTLVIDTVLFAPHRASIGYGVPVGSDRHLVERLTPGDTGASIDYSFELRDPEYLSEPLVIEGIVWWHRPDLNFETLPCDPENAQRFTQ